MKLLSAAFDHNGFIPRKYTCQGANINPPLKIEEVPENTASLALIMDDPDVPLTLRPDGLYVHWIVFNISPMLSLIEEAAPPIGTHGQNTEGSNRYLGPCPPDREHRYFFKLYALDIKLDVDAGITKDELLKAMEGHILEHAELMGRYNKS